MSFGTRGAGTAWTLDEGAAGVVFQQAVELGITFWDTANMYAKGPSEEITGRAIKNRPVGSSRRPPTRGLSPRIEVTDMES